MNMASGLADDALEVLSSDGTCEYPGYVSYRVLKGCLGRSLSYVRLQCILKTWINPLKECNVSVNEDVMSSWMNDLADLSGEAIGKLSGNFDTKRSHCVNIGSHQSQQTRQQNAIKVTCWLNLMFT